MFKGSFRLNFLRSLYSKFKKGPPRSSNINFFNIFNRMIFDQFEYRKMFRVYRNNFCFIFICNFFYKTPTTNDRLLFAIKILLEILVIEIVGCSPSNPGIAEIVISDFFFRLISSNLFRNLIFFFFKFLFYF